MKSRLFLLCCALPLLLACSDHDDSTIFQSVPVIGSGDIVSEVRSVPPFDSVDLSAVADVTITEGASQEVRIRTDDNIIEHLSTRVSGGVLIIDTDVDYETVHGVKITIEAKDVRHLLLTGAGTITGTGLASGGDLRATLIGVGTISLSGTTDSYEGTNAGVGTLDAENLLARRSTIVISGTGNCRVTATDELDVTISGFGDVYYAGDPPTVRSTITGIGRLIPI